MTLRLGLISLALLSFLVPLRADDSVPQTVVDRNGKELKLVWSEEFNVDGMPDRNVWNYEIGFVRNNEAQYYTEARPENIFQKDGFLTIRTLKENYPLEGKPNNRDRAAAEYTSAAIETKGKVSWVYGRCEVRAKFPKGKGIWPAIWMMGDRGGWPTNGEIDIMEYVGFDPGRTYGTIHTNKKGTPKGSNHIQKGSNVAIDAPEEKFHVYALEWEPDKLTILVDDIVVLEYYRSEEEPKMQDWPFEQPHYIILNTAIGGTWGGEIADDTCPTDFVVDYVRVYQ